VFCSDQSSQQEYDHNYTGEHIYRDYSRWYIDSAIKTKKKVGVYKLLAIYRDMFCSGRVIKNCSMNVSV